MSGATLIRSKNVTAGNLAVTGAMRQKTVSKFPQTGIPALAGAGTLSRFSNSFELYSHIHQNMPYLRANSLTSEEAWSLTAYVLRMNDRDE